MLLSNRVIGYLGVTMIEDSHREATEIVRSGYDKLAERYLTVREPINVSVVIDQFCALLSDGATILDVGCGTGLPIADSLVKKGFKVVGVDNSQAMVEVARKNIPAARFIQLNMIDLDTLEDLFDGLISCYAVFHIPREKHSQIFNSFFERISPGGVLLVSVGATDWEGIEDYHGVEMFWSHYRPEVSELLIRQAGLEILFGRSIESPGESHHWVLARKPAPAAD